MLGEEGHEASEYPCFTLESEEGGSGGGPPDFLAEEEQYC
jgi:hypothetical protein